MQKAFAYVRVSTEIQEEKGTQLNQESAIKQYIEKKEINIVEWFYDLAMSGTDADRPKLNEMINRLAEVDSIVVYDSSRLSRSFEYSMQLMFLFKEKQKYIHLVGENRVIDYNDDVNTLITTLYSWFADFERKKIKERQRLGIQRHIQDYGTWGPKVVKIDMRKYKALREAKVSKSAIARIFGVSRMTLLRRLKEANLYF